MSKSCFILPELFSGCLSADRVSHANHGKAGAERKTVLPKKITNITIRCNGFKTIYLYVYDSQGRLSKITEMYDDGVEICTTDIAYMDEQIIIMENDTPASVISLKNGKAGSYVEYDSVNYRSEYSFEYSDNYLSGMVCKNFRNNNGDWVAADGNKDVYILKNGNIASDLYSYSEGEKAYSGRMTYEMSKVNNNTNIDLYGLFTGEHTRLLCTLGNRYKNMPAKIIDREDGYGMTKTTYAYEVNREGYVIKIIENNSGSVTVYVIGYE